MTDAPTRIDALTDGLDGRLADLRSLYEDLHAHPELSMQEHRTAGVVAERLRAQGYEVTEGVGGTGVVGVLANGAGPRVLLRADMDGLPLREDTGLPFASTVTAIGADGVEVPVMHGCGHDVHVTALLGATAQLAENRGAWSGTVLAVFQPAEETGEGAQAMIEDDLFARFGTPDVCLGQHVSSLPAGHAMLRPGPMMATADAVHIRLFGRGGHGSTPELTVDPVVMGASLVMRLQTIASREISSQDPVVVTVGSLVAGMKENIIPDDAVLKISVRTFDPTIRDQVMAAIERMARAEAAASGAPREPEFTYLHSLPLNANDVDGEARTRAALALGLGTGHVHEMPRPVSGSEDFGRFGAAAGCPSVFWFVGGYDPALFADILAGRASIMSLPEGVAYNHSPHFAPSAPGTLDGAVRAMLAAASEWLGS
ncbi:amidohydrolase [Beutenbergia cavernae DSM 12333]|uniref:Amidohydrolase n=1 Tax=Beutenbergia cavernae (strain ATCC BAA-8 / DSM 12333 / CCUG 43141 / JCM 11478 / NBRC 16432 / NCIMB 13614 / HKI 0122) TaxID=471853 RepID=C5BXR2_BEUC1|nr:amidohydrolase [Beutenbergia cavernae]ACQ78806.1 amidohydrolase [Beutenbergia cavernae DSM 12333]